MQNLRVAGSKPMILSFTMMVSLLKDSGEQATYHFLHFGISLTSRNAKERNPGES